LRLTYPWIEDELRKAGRTSPAKEVLV